MTDAGAPAAAVELLLRLWDGSQGSTIATTATDASGTYLFGSVPALGQGELYYVVYGPNMSDPIRLFIIFRA